MKTLKFQVKLVVEDEIASEFAREYIREAVGHWSKQTDPEDTAIWTIGDKITVKPVK